MGLLAASFFSAEAYVVYVLQDRWGLSVGHAGIALTVSWASCGPRQPVQSRLGARISHERAMRWGTAVVLTGLVVLVVAVALRGRGSDLPAVLPVRGVRPGGGGHGLRYPRTSVAMLAESTDRDRGLNTSALSVADSLGAALALSVSGVAFAAARSSGADPFLVVYALAAANRGAGRPRRRQTRT